MLKRLLDDDKTPSPDQLGQFAAQVETANGIDPVFDWRAKSCRIPSQTSMA
jgi:hypothetical protein